MVEKYKDYSNTWVIDSGRPWPILAIFGWIHWNEIAWIKAINKIIEKSRNNEIKINTWKVILAYWNEKAIKIKQRDSKYNMNRLFQSKYLNSDSDEYEIKRLKQLSDILKNSDYLLDIHSVSSESEPFLFAENVNWELDIASYLWLEKIIYWWGEINANTIIGWDSDSYMHFLWKTAFTVECGNHNDKRAEDIACNTIRFFLAYLWMIDLFIKKTKVKLIKMDEIITTKTWKFVFVKWINNFSNIKKWDIIWYDWKKEIMAKKDFIILLPNYEDTKVWEEIFYLGLIS